MFFGEPFGGLIPGPQGAVLAVLLRTGTPLTGRQVHRVVSDRYSLWSVQEALKKLAGLGVVRTRTIGRSGIHTVNEEHATIAPLRTLADPIAALVAAIRAGVDSRVRAVVLFGSIARGESTPESDIDLAVIASAGWDGWADLRDVVQTRLGNDCDVVAFTAAEFGRRARAREPVVADILRDGVALVGSKPRVRLGAA